MDNENEKPFIDYLNAVDSLIEARTGETSNQADMDEIAGAQESGHSPEDCAEAIIRRIAIRKLNDLCRTAMGVAGKLVQTAGICALPPADQSAIRETVERFDDFTEDNDPYGERDFGAFDYQGKKIFWKIDYYNQDLTQGSEDPADPKQTCRVLTILLAEEY